MLIPTPSLVGAHYDYEKTVRIAKQFVPFYRYYFDYYKPSQKLIAMRFLQNYRVHDDQLSKNFMKTVK